jgi:MarR family transcriptional regulator, multiple gene regulator MgrA
MGIEQCIQQDKPFQSEKQRALISVLHVAGCMQHKLNELFANVGITWQQFNILRILRGQQPESLCLGEIKQRMIDKNSDVSRLLVRLERKELIEKKPGETDRRRSQVVISAKGLELLAKVDENSHLTPERVLDCISDEEAVELANYMEKLLNHQ